MASADVTGALQPASARVRIRPPRRWDGLGLPILLEYKELIYFLAKREIQVKYKQSLFGISWAVMQPLAISFLFALVLGHYAGIATEGFPKAVYYICALVPWLFAAQAIGLSANSLVADSNLVSKVYFPRLALPISKILGLSLDLGISLVVLTGMILVYGVSLSSMAFLAPVFLLLAIVAAFGLGTLFAAVNVRYRDVTLVVPVLIQVMFFLTPIIYPGNTVTGPLRYVLAINPMVTVIDGMRWSLLGADGPGPVLAAISIASALIITTCAVLYFRRTEQFFADVI